MEDYLVTVEDLQKIVDFKTQKPVVHPFRFGEDMTKIVVKPFISLANYADMIKNIVAACVINGDYYVAFRDFAIKSNLLIYFTNITAGDADIVYSFIHSCPDTVDMVIKDIEKNYPTLHEDINDAILTEVDKAKSHRGLGIISDKIVEILNHLEENLGSVSVEDISKLVDIGGSLSGKSEKEIANAVLEAQEKESL